MTGKPTIRMPKPTLTRDTTIARPRSDAFLITYRRPCLASARTEVEPPCADGSERPIIGRAAAMKHPAALSRATRAPSQAVSPPASAGPAAPVTAEQGADDRAHGDPRRNRQKDGEAGQAR